MMPREEIISINKNPANLLPQLKTKLAELIFAYSALASSSENAAYTFVQKHDADKSDYSSPDFQKWIALLAQSGNKKTLNDLTKDYLKKNTSRKSLAESFNLEVITVQEKNSIPEGAIAVEGSFKLLSHQLMVLAKLYQYINTLNLETITQEDFGLALKDVMTISLTTGAGKTLIQGLLIKAFAAADIDIEIFFPDKTLIKQSFSDFRKLGFNCDEESGRVYVNSTQFFIPKTHEEFLEQEAEPSKVLLVDEAHLLSDLKEQSFMTLTDRLKQYWCFLVSASPSVALKNAIKNSEKTLKSMGELTNRDKVMLGMSQPINSYEKKPITLMESMQEIGMKPSSATKLDHMFRAELRSPINTLDEGMMQIDDSDIQVYDSDMRAALRRHFSSPMFAGKVLTHVSNYEDIVNTLYRYDIDPKGMEGWASKGHYYAKGCHHAVSNKQDLRDYLRIRKEKYLEIWHDRVEKIAQEVENIAQETASEHNRSDQREVILTKELLKYWNGVDKNTVELNAHLHGQVDFYLALFAAAMNKGLTGKADDVIKKYGPQGYLNKQRATTKSANALLMQFKDAMRDKSLVEKIKTFLHEETSLPEYVKTKFKLTDNIDHFAALLDNEQTGILLVENFALEDFRTLEKRQSTDSPSTKNYDEPAWDKFFGNSTELSNELRNLAFFKDVKKNELHVDEQSGVRESSIPENTVFSGLKMKKDPLFQIRKPTQSTTVLQNVISGLSATIDYGPLPFTFIPGQKYTEDEISFQHMKSLHLTGLAYQVSSDALMEAHDDVDLHVNIMQTSTMLDKTADPSNLAQAYGRNRARDPYRPNFAINIVKNDLDTLTFEQIASSDQFFYYQEALNKKLGLTIEDLIAEYQTHLIKIASDSTSLLEKEKEFLKQDVRVIEEIMRNLSFKQDDAIFTLNYIKRKVELNIQGNIEKIRARKSNYSFSERMKTSAIAGLNRINTYLAKEHIPARNNSEHIERVEGEERIAIAKLATKIPLDNLSHLVGFLGGFALKHFHDLPNIVKDGQEIILEPKVIQESLKAVFTQPAVISGLLTSAYDSIHDTIKALPISNTRLIENFFQQLSSVCKLLPETSNLSLEFIQKELQTFKESLELNEHSEEVFIAAKTVFLSKLKETINPLDFDVKFTQGFHTLCDDFLKNIQGNKELKSLKDETLQILRSTHNVHNVLTEGLDLSILEKENALTVAIKTIEKKSGVELSKIKPNNMPILADYEQQLGDLQKALMQSPYLEHLTENIRLSIVTEITKDPVNLIAKLKSLGIDPEKTFVKGILDFVNAPQAAYISHTLGLLCSRGLIGADIINQVQKKIESSFFKSVLGKTDDTAILDLQVRVVKEEPVEMMSIEQLLNKAKEDAIGDLSLQDKIQCALDKLQENPFQGIKNTLSSSLDEIVQSLPIVSRNLERFSLLNKEDSEQDSILKLFHVHKLITTVSFGLNAASTFLNDEKSTNDIIDSVVTFAESFQGLLKETLPMEDHSSVSLNQSPKPAFYNLMIGQVHEVVGTFTTLLQSAKSMTQESAPQSPTLDTLLAAVCKAALNNTEIIKELIGKFNELNGNLERIAVDFANLEKEIEGMPNRTPEEQEAKKRKKAPIEIFKKTKNLLGKLSFIMPVLKRALTALDHLSEDNKTQIVSALNNCIENKITFAQAMSSCWILLSNFSYNNLVRPYTGAAPNSWLATSLSWGAKVGKGLYYMPQFAYQSASWVSEKTLTTFGYDPSSVYTKTSQVANNSAGWVYEHSFFKYLGFGAQGLGIASSYIGGKTNEFYINPWIQELSELTTDLGKTLVSHGTAELEYRFKSKNIEETVKKKIEQNSSQVLNLLQASMLSSPASSIELLKHITALYPVTMQSIQALKAQGNQDAAVLIQAENVIFERLIEATQGVSFKHYWGQLQDLFTVQQMDEMAQVEGWAQLVNQFTHNTIDEGVTRSDMIMKFLRGFIAFEATLLHDQSLAVKGFPSGSLVAIIAESLSLFSLPMAAEEKNIITNSARKKLQDVPANFQQSILKYMVHNDSLGNIVDLNFLGALTPIVDEYLSIEGEKSLSGLETAMKLLQTSNKPTQEEGILNAFKKGLKSSKKPLISKLTSILENPANHQETPLNPLKKIPWWQRAWGVVSDVMQVIAQFILTIPSRVRKLFSTIRNQYQKSRRYFPKAGSGKISKKSQSSSSSSKKVRKSSEDLLESKKDSASRKVKKPLQFSGESSNPKKTTTKNKTR
jgi:hypothetical protein